MVNAPVADWGTAVMSSVAAALAVLLAAIPKVIGFALILIVGWLVASAIGALVATLLRAVHFTPEEVEMLLDAVQVAKYPEKARPKPSLDKFERFDSIRDKLQGATE